MAPLKAGWIGRKVSYTNGKFINCSRLHAAIEHTRPGNLFGNGIRHIINPNAVHFRNRAMIDRVQLQKHVDRSLFRDRQIDVRQVFALGNPRDVDSVVPHFNRTHGVDGQTQRAGRTDARNGCAKPNVREPNTSYLCRCRTVEAAKGGSFHGKLLVGRWCKRHEGMILDQSFCLVIDHRIGCIPFDTTNWAKRLIQQLIGTIEVVCDHDIRLCQSGIYKNGNRTRLFKNQMGKPGIRVRLKGSPGNPLGIGAVMRLQFESHLGPAREVHAGSGYWSQDSAIQVLAGPQEPQAIWIRWPGGQETTTTLPRKALEVEVDLEGSLHVIQERQ